MSTNEKAGFFRTRRKAVMKISGAAGKNGEKLWQAKPISKQRSRGQPS